MGGCACTGRKDDLASGLQSIREGCQAVRRGGTSSQTSRELLQDIEARVRELEDCLQAEGELDGFESCDEGDEEFPKDLPSDLEELVNMARQTLPNGAWTPWLRAWCTEEQLRIFNRARPTRAACAQLLGEALRTRAQYEEVLTGRRTPLWQSDLRVLTRDARGCPVIWCKEGSDTPGVPILGVHGKNHLITVFEAAAQGVRGGAKKFKFVYDCRNFSVAKADFEAMKVASFSSAMLKHIYRDRLESAVVIDAPRTWSLVWSVIMPIIPEATRKKIIFKTRAEIGEYLVSNMGEEAAKRIQQEIAEMTPLEKRRYPSELLD